MPLVLYRKYRPKTFSEVVGQEHIVRTLTNAIKENLLSHGYLFAGPHGTGKTTLARLLAKSLNCLNREENQFEPCNKCWSCQEINQGNAIDLIEIDAASNRGIDEIRELKDGILFKPVKSKYKVFIVDESHQLTKEASNALLKTLEEPPSHALFVLATTELHKVIPTIQSRCQTFQFRRLQVPEITARLKKILKSEKLAYEEPALDLIAFSAGGSIRDAETLLDEAVSFSAGGRVEEQTIRALLGTANRSQIFTFLNFLTTKQIKEALDFLNNLIGEGVDLKEFTKTVLEYLRELLFLKIDEHSQSPLFLSLLNEEKQQMLKMASGLSMPFIQKMLEELMATETKMKYSTILQLPLELAIVDICQSE